MFKKRMILLLFCCMACSTFADKASAAETQKQTTVFDENNRYADTGYFDDDYLMSLDLQDLKALEDELTEGLEEAATESDRLMEARQAKLAEYQARQEFGNLTARTSLGEIPVYLQKEIDELRSAWEEADRQYQEVAENTQLIEIRLNQVTSRIETAEGEDLAAEEPEAAEVPVVPEPLTVTKPSDDAAPAAEPAKPKIRTKKVAIGYHKTTLNQNISPTVATPTGQTAPQAPGPVQAPSGADGTQSAPPKPAPPALPPADDQPADNGPGPDDGTTEEDVPPDEENTPPDGQNEIRYVIAVMETPLGRTVLKSDGGKKRAFETAQVMALAKADPEDNTSGLPTIGLKDLASRLKDSLGAPEKFGRDCFHGYRPEADAEGAAGIPDEETVRAETARIPAITGPVIACGEANGKKAVGIYDADGNALSTVTRNMLNDELVMIADVLKQAQSVIDERLRRADSRAEDRDVFTGLPAKPFKPANDEENARVEPDDPLYLYKGKQGKKPADVLGAEVKDQYSLSQIGFTPYNDPRSAWNVVNAQQKNITVAVVDSGFDFDHPDAPAHIWTNTDEVPDNGIDDDGNGLIDDIHGWNFLNENHDFTDTRGHGTFVAGIIAAKTNNGIGIAGINPGAVIMPVKVADGNGIADSFDIFRAVNYAAANSARIINISLGARSVSELEQIAISQAYAKGILVVVAGGQDGGAMAGFGPSSARHAFTVEAANAGLARSERSNFGPNLALLAPGEEIYSLCAKDNKYVKPPVCKKGYYTESGTSYSAAMVTATASLMLAKDPGLTHAQVADLLMATARDMGRTGWDDLTGAGFLKAQAALRAKPEDTLTVFFTELRINHDDRGTAESVDLFATVRGNFKDYAIEAGKGRSAQRFKMIAGSMTRAVDDGFITRIDAKLHLRGSNEWVLRIKAKDKSGNEKLATTLLELE